MLMRHPPFTIRPLQGSRTYRFKKKRGPDHQTRVNGFCLYVAMMTCKDRRLKSQMKWEFEKYYLPRLCGVKNP